MDVSIKTIPEFDRRAKRLAKKYKSLKTDLQQLIITLRQVPAHGTDLGGGASYRPSTSVGVMIQCDFP